MWQKTSRPDAKRRWNTLRPLLPAIAVLLGGITISLFAASYVRQTNRRMDETWLRDHALQMEQVVTVRLDDFTDALVHTRAFFSAAKTTDARVLHSYLQEVGIFAKYPGILAVGYVRRVPARNLSGFVRQMRQIYPSYHVWPSGVREDYYPLAFSDPPSADSRRALGYDSAASPDRREAQLRAIRDDRPSATEKVSLARDRGKVGSPGFVLFLPVYRFGAPLATPAQRERAVTGMLNTVFRTPDFIRGVIGEIPLHTDISFDLYDGDTPNPSSLIYSLRPGERHGAGTSRIDHVQFGGRTWTFDFYTAPTFGTFWSREGHWMVLASGVAVSFLLFQLLWTTLRREKKERELLAQVRQALDARDEFIAIAAHELRTPITSLRLQLQMATRYQAGEQDPAAALARLSRIGQQQVARLTTLINELLDVTRIQAGRFKVNRQSTDLNLLVHEMAGHYRDSLVNGAEQLLAVRGDAEPVLADVDPLRLGQAVDNLLSNALKFGERRPIELRVEKIGGVGFIRVRDFGIGIPADRQDRLFRRFERTLGSESVGGLGLGLYITKQIIDAHQGRIHVQSRPGEGSTFSIELPLAEATA